MRHVYTFAVIGLIAGGMMAYFGFKEMALTRQSTVQPEEMPLAKLVERGPNGNPNILLTNYVCCDKFVYETKNKVWTHAWVPAIPYEGQRRQGDVRAGAPGEIKALIYTCIARSEVELYQRCEQPKLRVLVVNKMVSLGADDRRQLEKDYPGTDFNNCLFLQEGREPAGLPTLLTLAGGGTLVFLVALTICGFGVLSWLRARSTSGRHSRDEDESEEEPEERPRRRRPSRDDEE